MNPVLFPTFIKTFEANGHSFVRKMEECDVVLFDLHTRIADYNATDIGRLLIRSFPVVTFDEWDRGGMSDEVWPSPLTNQQLLVWKNIKSRSIHFCRLFNKNHEVPKNLYPLEKPILYEEPLLDADQLFNREYDIVWIANTAPQRERLASALRLEAKLKCNIILGAKKIPYQDWINEHKKGKLFISCSAGGYSNECVQSLFSVAGQLKEKNDQLLAHPFTNSVNSVMISDTPTRTLTGTVTETLMHTYTIAGGKLPTSCMPNLKIRIAKTGTAGTVTIKVRVNTVNDFATATNIGFFTSATTMLGSVFVRNFTLQGGQLTHTNAANSSINDESANANVNGIITYDPSVTQYWFISLQNSNAGDTTRVNSIKMVN